MIPPIIGSRLRKRSGTVCAIVAAGVLLAACNPFGTSEKAEQAVVALHELYDAEQFDVIYDGASDQFRETMTRSATVEFLQDVRDRLGPVVATVKESNMVKTSMLLELTVTLGYVTTYERGQAKETFVFELTDSLSGKEARLLGWIIDDSK